MPPRKRNTRAQKVRAKPELKEADENKNGLSAKEKKEKLERYLQDFDVQVENMIKKFRNEEVYLQRLTKKHFNAMLVEFLRTQRKMTVEDYCVEMEEMEKLEKAKESSIAGENDHLPELTSHSLPIQDPMLQSQQFGSICQTLSKYRSQPKRIIEPIPEEAGALTTTQKKTRKGGRKGPGQGVTFNADPPPSTLPRNSRFITPAEQRNLSVLGLNTPLITPKFDPRLPITPAQKRQARPGEVIMSMAGSPVQVPKERTLVLPLPEGQEFDQLLEENSVLDDMDITNAKSHMSRVVNMLSNIIKAQKLDKDS